MCTQEKCEYGHQCDGCLYYVEKRRKYSKTGIDTSDMRAYRRERMRRNRKEKKDAEIAATGVRA